MRELLWISPTEALAVVLATIGMYLALVVFVRILGQRVLSGMSSFDLVAVIAFGSLLGRAALGETPRFAAGVLALATLLTMQGIVGLIRRRGWGATAVTRRPVLLMAGDQVIEGHLRRCHVQLTELQSRLRQSGIRHPREVAAVILEPSGTISVLRRGEPIQPALLDGVAGAADLPAELLSAPDRHG